MLLSRRGSTCKQRMREFWKEQNGLKLGMPKPGNGGSLTNGFHLGSRKGGEQDNKAPKKLLSNLLQVWCQTLEEELDGLHVCEYSEKSATTRPTSASAPRIAPKTSLSTAMNYRAGRNALRLGDFGYHLVSC